MKNKLKIFFLPFALLLACVDPYEPPAILAPNRYLVVEGFLNSGSGETRVMLSRTSNLADSAKILPELGAEVRVEGESFVRNLTDEDSDGIYTFAHLDLNPQEHYQLRIKTKEGKEYLSDPVQPTQAPPIDSLSWIRKGEGVEIQVDTHDPAKKSWYYWWEYEETWEFDAAYISWLEYIDGQLVDRPVENRNFTCWGSAKSNSIQLASSIKLQEDVITQQPLLLIPEGSWKLSKRYSVLVRQRVVTPEAFQYLQQMKKNTEQQGSVFDPQPSEIKGNIYCLDNSEEPVVGYISAGSVQEHRIFISNEQLEEWNYFHGCQIMEIAEGKADEVFPSTSFDPLQLDSSTGTLTYASKRCTDCTTRGNKEKPAFWN